MILNMFPSMLFEIPFILGMLLYIIPGLLATLLMSSTKENPSETLLLSYVLLNIPLSISINIILDYILSSIKICNIHSISIIYLIFSLLILLIFYSKIRASKTKLIKLSSHRIRILLPSLISKRLFFELANLAIVIFLFTYLYIQHTFRTTLPLTWDRGRQLAYIIFVIKYGYMSPYYPGSTNSLKYLQGYTFSVMPLILFVRYFYENIFHYPFNSEGLKTVIIISLILKRFNLIILVNIILMVYLLVRRFYGYLSALISLTVALAFASVVISLSSLSAFLSILLFLSVIFLLLEQIATVKRRYHKRLLITLTLIVLLSSLFLTHITLSFVFILSIFIITVLYLVRAKLPSNSNNKELIKILLVITCVAVFFSLFLVIINPLGNGLLTGLLQAFSHESSITEKYIIRYTKRYYIKANTFSLLKREFLNNPFSQIVFILLSVISLYSLVYFSFVQEAKKSHECVFMALLWALFIGYFIRIYPIRRIITRPEVMVYLYIVLSSGILRTCISNMMKNRRVKSIVLSLRIKGKRAWLLMQPSRGSTRVVGFLLLEAFLIMSIINTHLCYINMPTEYKVTCISYKIFDVIKIVSSRVILLNDTKYKNVLFFPDSPDGYLCYTFLFDINTTVYFANPCVPDIKDWQILSIVFDKCSTAYAVYDFSGIPLDDKINILKKYNIGIIVINGIAIFNEEKFRQIASIEKHVIGNYKIYFLTSLNDC